MQKKHIRNMLMASFLIFISTAGQTQQNTSGYGSNAGIERMSREIGLNEAQKSKFKTILNEEKKKVDVISNEERKKLQRVQNETRSSLAKVLTPGQMSNFDNKMRQKRN